MVRRDLKHLSMASVSAPGTASDEAAIHRAEMATLTDEKDLLAVLQQDIAARLRPVCSAMIEVEFAQLVADIAAVKLKYGVEAQFSAAFRDRLTLPVEKLPTDTNTEPAS